MLTRGICRVRPVHCAAAVACIHAALQGAGHARCCCMMHICRWFGCPQVFFAALASVAVLRTFLCMLRLSLAYWLFCFFVFCGAPWPATISYFICAKQRLVLSRIVRHFDYTVLSSGGSSDSWCLFCSFAVELVAVFSLSV